MTIFCVDRSPLGLMEFVKPDAVIYACRDPEKALQLAEREGCDVLLTEIDLGGPEREGLDFAMRMQAIHPAINVIFVTTYSESDYARDVIQMRASGFLRKPYKQQQLAEEFAHLRYAPKSQTIFRGDGKMSSAT